MTNSPHTLLKDIINLLEQCPVTSDTDWIVKRNDIIVRSRQAIAELKKGEIPQMANVDSVGRCYAEAFSKSKAEHSPRCNDALHRDAARWAVYQMGFEDGVRLYNGAPTNPVIPAVEEVDDLWDEIGRYFALYMEIRDFAFAVLERWGSPRPSPIAISERLPSAEAGDLDSEERCWVSKAEYKSIIYDCNPIDAEEITYPSSYSLVKIHPSINPNRTWLPHWALPIPVANPNKEGT